MTYILLSQQGNAGCITLNRPKALNAMTIEMVNEMSQALKNWADNDAISHIIITSSAPRAFCAGGDVRQAVSLIADNPDKGAVPYFDAEYGFDALLADYPKPVIALTSGIVMGGGFGVARLADYMVVTSDLRLAMPETAIGLFPDVGASCFLRRAPLPAALMMGMTGTIIGAGDAIAWQIADYHCDDGDLSALCQALCQATNRTEIEALLLQYHKAPPQPHFAAMMADITTVFGASDIASIRQAADELAQSGGEASWHHALSQKCPMSIAAFWYMMTQLPVPESNGAAIRRDYFLACKMTARSDFTEGVRAVLIDKDNKPQWVPEGLAQIDDAMLGDLFDFDSMTPLPD